MTQIALKQQENSQQACGNVIRAPARDNKEVNTVMQPIDTRKELQQPKVAEIKLTQALQGLNMQEKNKK